MLSKKCSNKETNENRSLQMINAENYKTLKELSKIYTPLFTESALRQMLHKDTDGIKSCTFHIGGKLLFNIVKFEQWFKEREIKGGGGK